MVFALSIGLLNSIDFVIGGKLFSFFALNTEKIFLNYEFWRLLSYPFFFDSAESLFLFIAIFIFVSPKLEYFLSSKIYPLFLFMISFVIGAITSIVFNSEKIIVGGMEGISFFIIALFMLLLIKDKYLIKKQPALVICISTVAIWGLFKIFYVIFSKINFIMPSIAFSISGLVLGFLVYLQINYVIKLKGSKTKIKVKRIKLPSSEELSNTMYKNPNFRELITNLNFLSSMKSVQTDVNVEYAANNLEQEIMDDEDRLNMILEKIFENGKDSISPDELLFLENYSNKL